MRAKALADAMLLVRQKESGVISTISNNLRGYPFGSVSPYITDSVGRPIFYISDIAQHAKNLTLDSRLSLTIYTQADSGDQNAQGRVTIVGDATPVPEDEVQVLKNQYVRMHPAAASYEDAHDFKLWRMDVVRVRYIGGFGKIFWLEQDEWLQAPSPWTPEQETGMVEHMNEDHQDAMTLMLAQHTRIQDPAPIMSGVLSDGCYIRSQDKNYFIPFANVCQASGDVRKELVHLTHQARNAA